MWQHQQFDPVPSHVSANVFGIEIIINTCSVHLWSTTKKHCYSSVGQTRPSVVTSGTPSNSLDMWQTSKCRSCLILFSLLKLLSIVWASISTVYIIYVKYMLHVCHIYDICEHRIDIVRNVQLKHICHIDITYMSALCKHICDIHM